MHVLYYVTLGVGIQPQVQLFSVMCFETNVQELAQTSLLVLDSLACEITLG